jgi:two-component system response regulator HydG
MDIRQWEILVFVNESHHRVGAIKSVLGDWGYSVCIAAGFEEACDMLHTKQWDLVITDLSVVCGEGRSFLGQVLTLMPFSSVMILTETFGSERETDVYYQAPGYFLIEPGTGKGDIFSSRCEEQEAEEVKLKISLN